MILATVIYYRTAALTSAVEKSMLTLTPLETHFTRSKLTAFLRQLSVYFLYYYLELRFVFWIAEVLLIKAGLDLRNLGLFCEPSNSLGALYSVLWPSVGTFSPLSLIFIPALVQRAAILFPPLPPGPSSWNEVCLICLQKRLSTGQGIRGPI